MPEPAFLKFQRSDPENTVTRYDRELVVSPALRGEGTHIACHIWRYGDDDGHGQQHAGIVLSRDETAQLIAHLAANLAASTDMLLEHPASEEGA